VVNGLLRAIPGRLVTREKATPPAAGGAQPQAPPTKQGKTAP
jgi:hypothetical protein